MSLTYSIADDFVILAAREETGSEELLQVFHAVTAEPHCPDPARVLLFASSLTGSTPTVEAQRIASILASHEVRFPRTALVTKSDLGFGQGRMIETYCGLAGVDFRVFRELETAASWLEQPTPPREVAAPKYLSGPTPPPIPEPVRKLRRRQP